MRFRTPGRRRRVAYVVPLGALAFCLVTASMALAAADTTPPRSIATPERQPDTNGWYRSDSLKVTLTVTDDESGIYQIEWVHNGMPQSASAYSPPPKKVVKTFDICCNNIHTIKYRATDQAGNVETEHTLILRLDARPPIVELNPTTDGLNDYVSWTSGKWYVHFDCSDPTYNSGLISSGCAGDSSLTIDGKARDANVVQTISAEGRHFVKGQEHDVAWNLGSAGRALNIDRRAPVVRVLAPDNGVLIGGPGGVLLSGVAADPLLADGTPGSGVTRAQFRVSDATTGEFVGFFDASPAAGTVWSAIADLPTGTYSIVMSADDQARSTGFSPPVTVRVIRVKQTTPLLPLEDVRSVVEKLIDAPPPASQVLQDVRAIVEGFAQRP